MSSIKQYFPIFTTHPDLYENIKERILGRIKGK
jgi:hypothetical protein